MGIRAWLFQSLGVCFPLVLAAQFGPGSSTEVPGPPRRGIPASPSPNISSSSGSVPTGTATADTIALTLLDAIDRGLKYNLGVISGEQLTRLATAQRLTALSALLPNVTGRVTETSQQVNLAAFGFRGFPGTPQIVGPFQIFDARATLTQAILDFSALAGRRSAEESERASRFGLENARDAVVLAVVNLYLAGIAAAARVESSAAQVRTAEAEFKQASDLRAAGVVAGIDVLRARVQLQGEQQRLIAARNESERQLLNLSRAIGLPSGQRFRLGDQVPYNVPPAITVEEALTRAGATRPDLKAALASSRAAELQIRAAEAQRLPALYFSGNYGTIGPRIYENHGTFAAALALELPIYEGGRIRADVLRAQAEEQQRKAEASDLRGRIDYEIRTAFLDMQAARDQVEVARSSADLASQELTQARDRFAAGVANNLEVVQAQEAVANASESVISSLYAYNLAKAALGRAVGSARKTVPEFLGVTTP